jgi:endonuclease/exonuclease/phosphatase family metal-dependent hydrolase
VTTLRVLSWNIHGGVGTDGVLDLERVADVIAATGAEVVALQEVDRHRREQSRFEDQPAVLGTRLGLHTAYAVCLDDEPAHPGGPRAQYGTALLSTRPFRSATTTLLPCFAGSEQRGLLDAVVEVGGAVVRLLGTHLQWDREDERLEQARAITSVLDGRPTLLLGDLNTPPGSPTHAHLAGSLVDAWTAAGSGPGTTFDAEPPPRRIDYVWTRGAVGALHAEVVRTAASDHHALLVEVELG